jgi:L-asparaginase
MRIRIIITGGTFDKDYDELRGSLTFHRTHLPQILKQIRCTVPIVLELNQLIDSLDMGLENRRKILASCRKSRERHILITHGTDTMVETARLLGQAGLPKTIVLTGAMVPYAVANSEMLPDGVYIAMNGKVFAWDRVRKNPEQGIFEEQEP